MKVHKRSYSPTIDDIRQHNIKKQRLLEDFDALNLSTRYTKHYETVQPQSTPTTEYIPDIDEFLLLNQDDRDVLEGSRHIEWDATELEKVVIPEQVTRVSALTEQDEKTSLERILGRRRVDAMLGRCSIAGLSVSEEEILLDHEIRMHWSLVKYSPAQELVYHHWEKWWINVHKLDEFMRQLNGDGVNDNDDMIDDGVDVDMDVDEEYDDDTMDIDE